MTLQNIVRKIHLYTGLQASISLLIFSISALTFPFEEEHEPIVTHLKYIGDVNTENIDLAKNLHKQVGLRFEAVPEWWMISEKKPGNLLIRTKSPKALREIRLHKTSRDIEITSWPLTFSEFINHMHQESFGRRRLTDSLWLWGWSLYIEISILALFTLPVTGLYCWITGRSAKKYWANLSLISSLMTMIVLWNLLR